MSFSFNHIGNLGHLGNQMFQYSFLKGISNKHSRPFKIAPPETFGSRYNLRSRFDECFNITCDRKISSYKVYQEKHFHFDKDLFENPPEDNIDFCGYFQSEKYFKHIENEIKKDFTFIPEIFNPSKELFDSLESSDVISLHIRRDDYVTNPNHPVQDIEYYRNALDLLPKDIIVLVFTDDVQWAKKQKIFSEDRFLISESNNCFVDMCLMTMCSHHIICNSTFSWWGSWLSNSKKTIAPSNWFGGDCINHNTNDLYCSTWKVI